MMFFRALRFLFWFVGWLVVFFFSFSDSGSNLDHTLHVVIMIYSICNWNSLSLAFITPVFFKSIGQLPCEMS